MSREIKFRAWVNSQMITPPDVTIGAGSSAEIIEIALDGRVSLRNAYGLDVFSKNPAFDESQKGIVLMQYTGLKDKNGKEIYEGDIVSNGPDKVNHRVIIWFRNCFWFNQIHGNGNFPIHLLFNEMTYEVIGNIYENPELLEEVNK